MDKKDILGKVVSLFFACTGVLFIAGIGISLSYHRLGLAIFFALSSILLIGAGFIVRAKLRR